MKFIGLNSLIFAVPNVPYGVESLALTESSLQGLAFLMYRMELKATVAGKGFSFISPVPNVPYGVERTDLQAVQLLACFVPNVPYGVERYSSTVEEASKNLVPNVPYGVESPPLGKVNFLGRAIVPNVPYGVERILLSVKSYPTHRFLMYRMELKVTLR